MKYTWIALHPPRLMCTQTWDTEAEAEKNRNESWQEAYWSDYPVMEYEQAKKLCNSLWNRMKWAILKYLIGIAG